MLDDKLLRKTERRITAEYEQAAKETRKKFFDYMRRFRIKDDIKRKAMEADLITRQEYIAWRRDQIMNGKRWAEMVDTLADDMHNANEIARSTIIGHLPDAYSYSRNYAAFIIDQTSPVDISFSLYSKETIEYLIRENPELLPPPKPDGNTALKLVQNKDLRWNRQKISSALTQGILQGESIPKMAKRLESVGEMNHKAAIRNARTMNTAAQNAGRLDAERYAKSKGVEIVNVWAATLDMRTRHEHRLLDGQKREIDEPFESEGEKIMYPGDPSASPNMVYNCRCTLIPQVKGFEYDIREDPDLDLTQIDGMTYAEWRESYEERTNPILLPEQKAADIKGAYIQEYIKLRKKLGS